jgi:hypothetical protein
VYFTRSAISINATGRLGDAGRDPPEIQYVGQWPRFAVILMHLIADLWAYPMRRVSVSGGGARLVAMSKHPSNSISGLVVEYIVAIDVTRVRFPADALLVVARQWSFW